MLVRSIASPGQTGLKMFMRPRYKRPSWLTRYDVVTTLAMMSNYRNQHKSLLKKGMGKSGKIGEKKPQGKRSNSKYVCKESQPFPKTTL
jgi:hypothetical protein